MSHEFAFAVTVGTEPISEKAMCLVKSLRRLYPEAPILTYVTDAELPGIPDETVDFFRTNTTLRTGGFPRDDYPISAKLRAMTLASDLFEFDYLAMLDADTVLLRPLDDFIDSSPSGDVYAKPVDISGKWDTEADWRQVVSATGYEMPRRRTVSTVDKRRIIPFYNAGVVITTDPAFPEEWLALTVSVYDSIEDGNPVFSDQIALGLLAQRYDLVELTDLENYPLHLYPTLSPDTVLIHYHDYASLTKVRDDDVLDILDEIDLSEKIPDRARAVSRVYEPAYSDADSLPNEIATVLKQEELQTIVRGVGDKLSTALDR
jgi:hypothetical protein